MKLINANLVVHWEAYDDEHESFTRHSGTIAEFLDQMTDEGCPETVDAVQVVHGHWIDIDTETYTWKIRCSRCGHERSMMSTGKIYPMWCENCGARMDGEAHD